MKLNVPLPVAIAGTVVLVSLAVFLAIRSLSSRPGGTLTPVPNAMPASMSAQLGQKARVQMQTGAGRPGMPGTPAGMPGAPPGGMPGMPGAPR